MLNEIGEYEQYTLSPAELLACKNRRLKRYTLIKQDFGGLERAMTIIARHFIFDTPIGFNEKELREILKAWCGFRHEAETILPEHFEGWLNNYMRRVLLRETLQDCLDDEKFPTDLKALIEKISLEPDFNAREYLKALKGFDLTHGDIPKIKNLLEALVALPNKNKNFSKNYFDSLTYKGKNAFRAITYDKVIANALLAGRLRRYYLVCDEELFATERILKRDGKKILPKDKDMVLKMTAEYLLQCRHTEQRFIVTNNADMTNWLLGSVKSEDLRPKREQYILSESKEKVFELSEMIGGINVIKVTLNPEWAKHFCLIEDESNDFENNRGRIFFSDAGSSEALTEEKF